LRNSEPDTLTSQWNDVLLRRRDILVFGIVAIWTSAVSYQLAASGLRHDYVAYVEQWAHILAGGNPWQIGGIPFNAYGPVHAVLAYAAIPSFLLPKYIFGLGFIILNFVFVALLLGKRRQNPVVDLLLYAFIVPLNFLIIGSVFLFGNNDALVAGLIGFGVLARMRGFLRIAGILFGLAILLKFYPLLLLPFLVFDRDRRWLIRPLIWTMSTVLVGAVLTSVRWGSSFLSAITGGSERDATILSILNFAREMQIDSSLYEWLVTWNTAFVVGAVALLLFLSVRYNVNWLVGANLAMLLTAALYKVGHQQFLVTWLVLLATLLVSNIRSGRFMLYISMPLVLFFSWYQYMFVEYWNVGVFWEEEGYFLRVWSGPIFFVSASTIVISTMLKYRQSRKDPQGEQSKTPFGP